MFDSVFSDPYKLVLAVLALHVYADFNLQVSGNLHNLKCQQWWFKQFYSNPQGMNYHAACRKYGRDYIPCLVLHAFSWSFVTFLPIIVQSGCDGLWAFCAVAANTAVHSVVDHLKANRLRINLVTDQVLRVIQIAMTVIAWMRHV